MTGRIKNIALIAASITALALGGSAIAGTASGGGGNSSDNSGNSAQAAKRGPAGLPQQGNAAYEAHMVRSDGTRVTVYVNESFDVVSVKSGP